MGVDFQGKLRLALGSVKDHATIGKAIMLHNYEGHGKGFSDIEIAVVRATGHDYAPIHDKYMHEILFLVTNSPASISFLAERMSRRLLKTRDRLVALKTLLLIHRLLRGGNRYFEQQLRNAHLSGHLQLTTACFIRNSDPSVCFLHEYAAYLEERMGWVINQAGKLEPVMSTFEEKSMDTLFRKLPRCQVFIDKVLKSSSFDFLPFDNLIQTAIINTLKESFQVYMAFSEGVAALVNMFFDLARPARSLACEILKRASTQSQELHHLYEKCKKYIENKNLEYPSVQIITMDHVLALEQCLGCTTSSYWLSTKIDTTPSILNCLTRWTDEDEEKGDDSLPSTLFSCTLETKISKVWVVFEDEEDFSKPGLLSGTLSDLPVHHQSTSGTEEITKTCTYLNPFAT